MNESRPKRDSVPAWVGFFQHSLPKIFGIFLLGFVLVPPQAWSQKADTLVRFYECFAKEEALACARKIVDKEMRKREKDPATWVLQGELRKIQRRHDEAFASYAKALELNPQYVDALTQRAILYFEVKRYAEGLADFKQVLMIQPGHMGAHMNLGAALMRLRKYEAAVPHLKKVVEADPENTMARVNLAVAYQALGIKAEEAQVHWNWLAANAPEIYQTFGPDYNPDELPDEGFDQKGLPEAPAAG